MYKYAGIAAATDGESITRTYQGPISTLLNLLRNMHFSTFTTALLLATAGLATAANSLTPNQRRSLNAAQANEILAAASKKAESMGYVMSTFTHPSALTHVF